MLEIGLPFQAITWVAASPPAVRRRHRGAEAGAASWPTGHAMNAWV